MKNIFAKITNSVRDKVESFIPSARAAGKGLRDLPGYREVELPKHQYANKSPYSMPKPIGVTIHETDNSATAANEISYMQRNTNKVSFHFAVDDKAIIQGLPLNRSAYHAGDGQGQGNRNTIGIEICGNYDRSNGGAVTDMYYKARPNAEQLVGMLLFLNNWNESNIYTHNDWSGKNCPRVIRREGYLPTFKANAMAWKRKFAGQTQGGDRNIIGTSNASVEPIIAHIKKQNPDFNGDIVRAFKKFGDMYVIDWPVAVAQSILETGWFKFKGSSVKPEQNNFCGLGAVGGGAAGASFATIEDGVEAQMQHLWAYASKDPIPAGRKNLDPRFHLVSRGSAKTWIGLNGKWATGANYGQKILNIYAGFSIVDNGPGPVTPPKPDTPSGTATINSGAVFRSLDSKYDGKAVGKGHINKPMSYVLNRVASRPSWVYFPSITSYVDRSQVTIGGGSVAPAKKSNTEIAKEIIAGKGGWGTGATRVNKLTSAGYDAAAVQKEVNRLMGGGASTSKPKKSNAEVAREIYRGEGGWGNNPERARKLKAAGYDPKVVQDLVNKM